MMYHYIIEAELVFLRYFKVNPFEIMKDISLIDLQVYMKLLEEKMKKDQDQFKNKDVTKALKAVCDYLNLIFYKEYQK